MFENGFPKELYNDVKSVEEMLPCAGYGNEEWLCSKELVEYRLNEQII